MERIASDTDRSYRWLRAFIVGCLVAYVVISVSFSKFSSEPYFFFTWFVFPTVPSHHQVEHDILLLSVVGALLEKPISLVAAKGIYTVQGINSPEYRRRIEAFSQGVVVSPVNSQVKNLIDTLIVPRTAHYELVEYTYDPIQRWKDGTIEHTRVIAQYDK